MPPKSIKLLLPTISPAAPGTLYEQIVAGLKRAIGERKINAGDALPSFRQLAEELLVSVITVKRAYEELEREGIIFRRQGLGTFVTEGGGERSCEVKIQFARTLLKDAAREATEAGLKPADIRRLFLESLSESLSESP
ncbi:MAG: GntR family transcriptional regulator [Verrucomicrobia bacterium]|nr:MAG: GntR family transcriptional regulator [Verrucomicrobiota bacterium]